MKHIITTGAILAIAGSASAQVTASVSDQASVEASLPNPIVEDFNDETVGSLPEGGVAVPFNGFSVTANGTSTFEDFAIDGDGIENSLFLFPDPAGDNIPSFTFAFDSPVDTFAALFSSPFSGGGLTFNFSDGSSIFVGDIAGVDALGDTYIAFTSATPFVSVDFDSPTLEAVAIDNVVTGLVPAPGAAGLAGLAGLAATRRRR